LTMTVTQLPAGVPALLFSGNAPNNGGLGSWFGDGLLCAGGPILRHDVFFANGFGTVTWASGLAAANGWGVGDSRYFQVWYRDVPGPCTSGFNTSNGLQMTYVP
jgi:hypothetical protein